MGDFKKIFIINAEIEHIFTFLSNKALKRLTLQALRVYNTSVNGGQTVTK